MAEMRTIEAVLHEEIDKLEELSRKDIGLTGTPSGFADIDDLTGGFQNGQPDRAGRPALDGQDHPRHQHRRERRHRPRQAGRAVLARDVRDRAGPPLHRLAGQGLQRRAAQGPRQGRPLAEGAARRREARRGADLHRRLQRHRRARDARQGAPAARPPRRARPDRRRLPAAGARRRPLRQPRRAGRPDQPWTEDPRPRARHPGGRRVAALARRRVAPPAGADALGPARERPARAGRGRRHVRLPRGVLRPGVRAPGRGRHHLRQAPQRADRQGHAQLPDRSTRGSRASTATTAPSRRCPTATGPADVLRRVEPQEAEACPFGVCDGSTWVLDEATGDARPCRCRDQRVRKAVSGGIGTGIGRRFLEVSFDREPIVSLDPIVLRQVRAFVRSIDEHLDAGRGLWFDGPVGTGKTSLAILVAKAAKDAGRSYAVYPVPRLLAEIKRTFDRDASDTYLGFFRRLCTVDVLVLDDLGAEKQTEWVLEQLYSIVNERWQDRRSIVVTTNIPDADPDAPARMLAGERPRPARSRCAGRRPRPGASCARSSTASSGWRPGWPSWTWTATTTRSCDCGARSARAPSRDWSRSATTRSRSWARTCAWPPRARSAAAPPYTRSRHARTGDRGRPVGRRGEGQGRRPARRAGRPGGPLPGRQQRRPHDRP